MLGNWRQSWSSVFILCSPSAVFIALTVADPGEGGAGRGARAIPLFLDQTDAPRSEKFFFLDRPLSQGLDDRLLPKSPPPPTPRLIWRSGSTPD